MRKALVFITALLLLASLIPLHTDAQVSGPARTIRYGPTLPSTCQTNGNNVFVKTSATTAQYFCSATNTWTALATGGGVSEPANQIVYGTGSGVDSSAAWTITPGNDATGSQVFYGVDTTTSFTDDFGTFFRLNRSAATVSGSYPGETLVQLNITAAASGVSELDGLNLIVSNQQGFAEYQQALSITSQLTAPMSLSATSNFKTGLFDGTDFSDLIITGSTVSNVAGVHYGLKLPNISGGATNFAIKTGTGPVDFGDNVKAVSYSSATNCSDSAGDAACSAAPAGSVVIDAGDTNTVVSTTAVTANSQVLLQFDASLGTRLSVTCNTTPAIPQVTARSAGTSFTITVAAAPVTNPMCLSFVIIN